MPSKNTSGETKCSAHFEKDGIEPMVYVENGVVASLANISMLDIELGVFGVADSNSNHRLLHYSLMLWFWKFIFLNFELIATYVVQFHALRNCSCFFVNFFEKSNSDVLD